VDGHDRSSHEPQPTRSLAARALVAEDAERPLRNRVNLRPRATTIAAINRRRAPRVVPRRRTAFERQVWQLTAQITEYKLEADDDIHLILFGTGAYMNAELPAPVVSLAENA
jgi:hypothetical protein